LLLLIEGLLSCHPKNDNELVLKKRVDSLEYRLTVTYKPGFSKLMSSVQAHHARLWFAGQNQNRKLADFKVHEIMEVIGGIQKYQIERKESKKVSMINPALGGVNSAIGKKI
jgi:hypothetical protein